MAYPRGPAQRPPPPRQYGPRRPPPPIYTGPDAYDQDYGYDGYENGGYDDGYGYYGDYAPPRSQGPPRAPRPPRGYGPPMEPPGSYGYDGRPPYGYDGRRPPPRRPPPQRGDRMRPREFDDNPNTTQSNVNQDKAGGRPARPPRGPDDMGYDNPFPAFPPPREKRYPPGAAGVETGMAAMDLNGPPPGRMPDRPSTANGRRPPVAPVSPGRSRGYPPPGRSASAGRPPDAMERAYTDPSGPPRMPPPVRSATMPMNMDASSKPMYPGQPAYQDPGYNRPTGDYEADDLLDSYYGSSHQEEPDMPNFDNIDSNKGVDESLPGLEQPKPKTTAPAPYPADMQYTAFSPQSSRGQEERGPTAPNQFAFAGFQFDIPGEAPQQPPNNMGYASYQDPGAAYPPSGGYSSSASMRSNGPPRPYRVNQPGAQTEAVDAQQNPDALPAHPVPAPYRPGHDKPAPVRQYTAGVNTSTAPQDPTQGDSAEQSGPVTQEEIQQLQQAARNNPSDPRTQLLLAKKLVEASTVLVDGSRLDSKSKAKAREKYVIDAHKIVKKLVQQGYPEAQFYLADCYGQGQLGLQPDPKEAFALYHSAAKAGHGPSAYRVAVCCEIGAEEGGGTKRDPFKAVQWYKRAASLGDTPAMYKMGMIQLKGLLGQARNPREGISWLKRAAERADTENPHALHELALMYSSASPNDIIVRDEEYAAQLFHQAAELGYKFSQFRLGVAYEHGLMNLPVDPRQSIIFYTHAASQGEHQSELALSGWYLTGAEGILQQSDTEAYLWARKAATAGLAKAEYAMGYFTEVGIGVAANLDDAKRWYWRAAG